MAGKGSGIIKKGAPETAKGRDLLPLPPTAGVGDSVKGRKEGRYWEGTGRPPVEEAMTLTQEMLSFAEYLSKGFTVDETAEAMGIPMEKAIRLGNARIVRQRAALLLNERSQMWDSLTDEMLTNLYHTMNKLINAEKIDWKSAQWLLERLEDQKGRKPAPPQQVPPTAGSGKGDGVDGGLEQDGESLFDYGPGIEEGE